MVCAILVVWHQLLSRNFSIADTFHMGLLANMFWNVLVKTKVFRTDLVPALPWYVLCVSEILPN